MTPSETPGGWLIPTVEPVFGFVAIPTTDDLYVWLSDAPTLDRVAVEVTRLRGAHLAVRQALAEATERAHAHGLEDVHTGNEITGVVFIPSSEDLVQILRSRPVPSQVRALIEQLHCVIVGLAQAIHYINGYVDNSCGFMRALHEF